jgi:hypothetical protein
LWSPAPAGFFDIGTRSNIHWRQYMLSTSACGHTRKRAVPYCAHTMHRQQRAALIQGGNTPRAHRPQYDRCFNKTYAATSLTHHNRAYAPQHDTHTAMGHSWPRRTQTPPRRRRRRQRLAHHVAGALRRAHRYRIGRVSARLPMYPTESSSGRISSACYTISVS